MDSPRQDGGDASVRDELAAIDALESSRDDPRTGRFWEAATPSAPSNTLLPSSVAKTVSFATRSTSLALRIGTLVGGYGLGAARATTLSSLELSRSILEGVLARSGRHVTARSRGELGRADAESLLEQSLESLHHTMTQIAFWASAGFETTGTTVSIMSDVTQLLLSSLDQIFGSTDSSRAIASIITLVRRELGNPATGAPGEQVGVLDLVLGICGVTLLQRWCSRLLEDEWARLGVEEVVWDVVVLNNRRIDIHEESLYGMHVRSPAPGGLALDAPMIMESSAADPTTSFAVQPRHIADDAGDDGDHDEPAELVLKRQIMSSLPEDVHVSMTTSISTTKTITVELKGDRTFTIPPPRGFELIEDGRGQGDDCRDGTRPPTYRVVYRVVRNRLTSTHMNGGQDESLPTVSAAEVETSGSTNDGTKASHDQSADIPPPTPPKPTTKDAKTKGKEPVNKASKVPSRIGAKENAANQKRLRAPLTPASSPAGDPAPPRKKPADTSSPSKANSPISRPGKQTEKKGSFRNALRKGPVAGFGKPNASPKPDKTETQQRPKAAQVSVRQGKPAQLKSSANEPVAPPPGPAGRPLPPAPDDEAPRLPPRRGDCQPLTHPHAVAVLVDPDPFPRSPSRASLVSVRETRRDSIVSQTDTYSVHSVGNSRPVSPVFQRTEVVAGRLVAESRSELDAADPEPPGPRKNSRRPELHGHTPSIYTLKTNHSETSLVPHAASHRGAFRDGDALAVLRRAGVADGMFPKAHLLANLCRYMRFASASYGSNLLRFLGIAKDVDLLRTPDDTHRELRWFAHHTRSDASNILVCSFVDPQGGSDSSGSTNTGFPLVHYISLDHESKAVVLACRGTMNFEDILVDMTCDYDDLAWRGTTYSVHKGFHASARRLLHGDDGRVLVTLKHALEEFTDYGLVLTGHSLGGSVTSLLGVMLAEPSPTGPSFVTSAQPLYSSGEPDGHITLPPGRPIHVYAYGPAPTMCGSLRAATQSLVTTVVHGNDIIPYLSLGNLHDFQALALAFKSDNGAAKLEARRRVSAAFRSALARQWYGAQQPAAAAAAAAADTDNDQWAYAALKVIRASMMSSKLVPPGEVFVVESTRVLRRDAPGGEGGSRAVGRPARRIVLRYVRHVKERFREPRMAASMVMDHTPGSYEDALGGLSAGVLGS